MVDNYTNEYVLENTYLLNKHLLNDAHDTGKFPAEFFARKLASVDGYTLYIYSKPIYSEDGLEQVYGEYSIGIAEDSEFDKNTYLLDNVIHSFVPCDLKVDGFKVLYTSLHNYYALIKPQNTEHYDYSKTYFTYKTINAPKPDIKKLNFDMISKSVKDDVISIVDESQLYHDYFVLNTLIETNELYNVLYESGQFNFIIDIDTINELFFQAANNLFIQNKMYPFELNQLHKENFDFEYFGINYDDYIKENKEKNNLPDLDKYVGILKEMMMEEEAGMEKTMQPNQHNNKNK